MNVFDTRLGFPKGSLYREGCFIVARTDPLGRYSLDFHWKNACREVVIRTTGDSTPLVEAVTAAASTRDLGQMDAVVQYLCPEFWPYWTSISEQWKSSERIQ